MTAETKAAAKASERVPRQSKVHMKVTFIGHSSFLVELEEKYLLFDYDKGMIPALSAEKPLYVFASHKHSDHFNPEIFLLADIYPKTVFILSYDIKIRAYQREKWNLKESAEEKIRTAASGRHYVLTPDGVLSEKETAQQSESPGWAETEIRTLKSTDAGVAFLVRTEGRVIYHAGDLNWWHWEGEQTQYNHNMAANFKREIDKLSGMEIDAAFLPLDPRLGEEYARGFRYLLETTRVKNAFPMHMWEEYSIVQKLMKESWIPGSETNIIEIMRAGQEWMI